MMGADGSRGADGRERERERERGGETRWGMGELYKDFSFFYARGGAVEVYCKN